MEKEEIVWTVTESSGKVTKTKSPEKLPFYTPIKITKDMDDNSKAFFNKYNEMQKALVDNGLMEVK